MGLGGQVQTVEEYDHRDRDHRDAPSVQIRWGPTREQQQRPRAGETDTRADHHLRW